MSAFLESIRQESRSTVTHGQHVWGIRRPPIGEQLAAGARLGAIRAAFAPPDADATHREPTAEESAEIIGQMQALVCSSVVSCGPVGGGQEPVRLTMDPDLSGGSVLWIGEITATETRAIFDAIDDLVGEAAKSVTTFPS